MKKEELASYKKYINYPTDKEILDFAKNNDMIISGPISTTLLVSFDTIYDRESKEVTVFLVKATKDSREAGEFNGWVIEIGKFDDGRVMTLEEAAKLASKKAFTQGLAVKELYVKTFDK